MMLRNNRPVQSWAKRMIHTAPRLKLQDQYTTQGIPGLLSPNGFKLAWIDQQNYLTTKLTLLTNGTSDETRYPFHIAINSARDQTKQPIFNVASQCHNNHFFFEQLTSPLTNTTSPSRDLESRIIDRFGSLDGLKKQFIEESEKIIGQGWVFLVETESKSLEILIVNNSGTPYNFSGNLSLDLNGPINSDEFEAWEAIKEHTLNKTTDWTIPLLGVSLWDHAYVLDYGVGQRAKYVGDALDAINWEVVNKRVYV